MGEQAVSHPVVYPFFGGKFGCIYQIFIQNSLHLFNVLKHFLHVSFLIQPKDKITMKDMFNQIRFSHIIQLVETLDIDL